MMIHAFLSKREHLTTLWVQVRHSFNNMDIVHMTYDSCNVKSQYRNVMFLWVPNLESYHPPYPASNIFPFVLYAKQVTVLLFNTKHI